MRRGSPSFESVLVVANVALALVVGGVYMNRDSGAAEAAAFDVSTPVRDVRAVLVVVAGDSPTDVAVGRPVAEALGGVLVAVPTTGWTEAMAAELAQSTPDRVLILGGPGAITRATASALAQSRTGSVTRLFGVDRYATSAKVATAQFRSPVPQVRILSGDAATRPAPPASREVTATPVLLVRRDSIPDDVAAALSRLKPQSIEVAGGPSAVSEAVLQQLLTYAPGRVARADGAGS
jgi:putative cell wall-binding protein